MRHRLYYLLPDVPAARTAMDELLLARIEARHIHFMSGASLPPELPEANLLQRTDIVRGAEMGMAVGAALGLLAGVGLLYYFDLDRAGVKAAVVVIAALVGMLFGAWASSMQGASLPNSRLASFSADLDKGGILLIADVPSSQVDLVETMLAERHPEMRFRGEESHIPTFP
jgi:hypothetical protein